MTIESKAVGAEQGKISISGASNSAVVTSGAGVRVKVTTLDQYEHLRPTLLKIDVEGFETKVLQGARKILSMRPKLAIEIHTEQLSRYGSSVHDLFSLIDVDSYQLWVQWEDNQEPEEYEVGTPIESRVHLFGVPLAGVST